ncbi:MAG: MFS transporter [Bacillota bacterium]
MTVFSYRKATLALFTASFITFSDVYMSQPLLPIFAEEFHVNSSVASLAVSLTVLPLGLSFIFYAPVAETIGKKKLLSIVLVLSAFPGIITANASSFEFILLGRLADGLLLAGVPAIAMAYIGEEFDSKKLASAMGLYISGNTLGGMGGRIISGILAEYFSWRTSFLALSLLHLAGAIAFIYLLPASKSFSPAPYRPLSVLNTAVSNLKNPLLLGAYITGGLITFNFVGIFNTLTFRLSDEPYNLSPDFIGLLFLTYLSGTFSSAMTGILSRQKGVLFSARLGLVMAVAGTVITISDSIPVIIVGLLVMCFGFFAAHTSATSWVSAVSGRDKAAASGLYVLFYYSGASLAGVVLSIVWDNWGWPGVAAVTSLLFTICIPLLSAISRKQIKNSSGQVLSL